MRLPTLVDRSATAGRGQSTVEFALVLPLVVACAMVLIAVLTVCTTTLALNDAARIFARAAAVSDDPVSTVTGLAHGAGMTSTTKVDEASGIIIVTLSRTIQMWSLGGIRSPRIRATASILREAPTVLG